MINHIVKAKIKGPSISVQNVQRRYKTGHTYNQVLKGISIDVMPGELTMIMGPSGSGKSTLLAVLSGLSRPDSGKVDVLNTSIWNLSPRQLDAFRLENYGFIFQGFNLFSALTALEQVMLPLNYSKLSKREALLAAETALHNVGLDDKKNLRPLELSGGEKQRVAIARALVKKPALIFADEPTSALDSENGRIVITLLHRAARQYGATVLAVTHDPRLIKHADRIVGIEDGVIQSDERQAGILPQA